ncbi:uncharacterized protein LTR77_007633 [Saxophila tyrrhenica]|uniref:Uncharacterized protein n=1 Tax=Saxophila tyrrhenica TaxID=1690608 RepID=A0AAV9P2M1_9PEZI|nr:hypothetical protein LTR77_007633 [Saxophila tyrrhenica]
MAAGICLPVLKFSHATSAPNESNIPWVHVASVDLFVTVDGDGDGTELKMQIIQRNTILDSVDIGAFVDEAIRMCNYNADQQSPVPYDQLPIFGMTKDVLLAVRYRQRDGTNRRLQLRMHTVADCQRILTIFRRRGLQFQEKRPSTGRPDTARLYTSSSQHRPSTAHTNAVTSSSTQKALSKPFNLTTLEAGSLSQHRSTSPVRSEHPVTTTNDSSYQPSSNHTPSVYFTRDEHLIPRTAEPDRPSTAHFYRSGAAVPQPAPSRSIERNAYGSTPIPDSSKRISPARGSDTIRPFTTASRRSLYDIDLGSSGPSEGPPNRALFSSGNSELHPQSARPASSTISPFPPTLEHEIPPRRALPFKRPQSHRSGSDGPSSRPASALPTLPPPSQLKGASSQPADVINRASTGSPLKRPFEASVTEHPQHATGHTAPQRRRPSPKVARKEHQHCTGDNTALGILDHRSAKGQPLAETSVNTRISRLDSLADAPHEVISPPQTAASSPQKRTSALDDSSTVGHSAGRSLVLASGTGDSDLSQYAAQSREDRAAALEEFMISNLENGSFTKLCQDIENCWQRIALGL